MQAPCCDGVVRSCFANHKPIDISSIIASPAKQIRDLQAMDAVFFNLQFANDVCRSSIERRAIVGVTIAGRLHWRSDVGELGDVRNLLLCALTGNVLNQYRRVRWPSKSLRGDFDPPDIALGGSEFKRIDISGRKETPGQVTRQSNLLDLSRPVVWFCLRQRGCFGQSGRWP